MTKHLPPLEHFKGFDLPTIDRHVEVMAEAGLIMAYKETQTGKGTFGWNIMRLTWHGHEFLDTVRDPEIWRKTKSGAAAAGGYGFGFLKDLATAYAEHVAKERLGRDVWMRQGPVVCVGCPGGGTSPTGGTCGCR